MIDILTVLYYLLGGGAILLAVVLGIVVLLVMVFLFVKTVTMAVLFGKLRFYQRRKKEMENNGKPRKT